MTSTIFIKKYEANSSPLSSDLPSKLEIDTIKTNASTSSFSPKIATFGLISDTSPEKDFYGKMHTYNQKNGKSYMLSETSPDQSNNRPYILSETSPDYQYDRSRIFSETSPDHDGSRSRTLSDTSIDQNEAKQYMNDWENKNYYFSQLDMDIAWIDNKNDSNTLLFGDLIKYFGKSARVPLPVVSDYDKAIDVAEKICRYAYYVNNPKKTDLFPGDKFVKSSVEKNKYSYPIFGSVIFTMKFKEKPKILNIGRADKSDYGKIFENKDADMIIYTTNWDNKERAVIFNVSKLDITDINLKTFECALGSVKGLAMLKILGSSSNEDRFKPKYINLLEKLCMEGGHVNLQTTQ